MSDRKKFNLSAALGIVTGKLFGDFDEVHELSEWLAGHPIWTHEFADKTLRQRLRAVALEQHPQLESADASTVTGDNWETHLTEWQRRFGEQLEFARRIIQREESPLESLKRIAPGKPVIVVEVNR